MTAEPRASTLAVLLSVLLTSCGAEEKASEPVLRPVRASYVADVSDMSKRTFPGRARATQEVEMSFRVSGPLISLPVKVGDAVDSGQLLGRIDPRDFEVTLRNAEGQLQRTKANLDRATSEYQRLKGIRAKNAELVSEVQLERAREQFELSKADVAALEATVDAAGDALDYSFMKAPFPGTIVATYVENFEFVQAQQPVLRLLDRQRIEFVINIPETLISLAEHVTGLSVRFDAFPELEVPAELHEIGTEASAETRTYPITLIMDQPEGAKILPGMSGTASGRAAPLAGGEVIDIVVPVTAVFSHQAGERNYIWVIEESSQTVALREVVLGELVSSGVVVTSGLETGELIATAGAHFLAEGQKVRPLVE